LTQDDIGEMTRLSQIPILDGEEWSLSEAIDSGEDENQSVIEED
jgi:hypothetical protein